MTARRTSPRTADLPMAFTMWEFVRGALLTYVFFLAFSAAAWIWTLFGVLFAPLYVAPYGFASLVLCGAPLAYLTGMLLRRETRTWVHLMWHGVVGFAAGGFGVLVALCVWGGDIWEFTAPHWPDWSLLDGAWIIAWVEALVTIGAAMLGWRVTSQRALRSDPGWIAPVVVDPRSDDERAEDEAAAREDAELRGSR